MERMWMSLKDGLGRSELEPVGVRLRILRDVAAGLAFLHNLPADVRSFIRVPSIAHVSWLDQAATHTATATAPCHMQAAGRVWLGVWVGVEEDKGGDGGDDEGKTTWDGGGVCRWM